MEMGGSRRVDRAGRSVYTGPARTGRGAASLTTAGAVSNREDRLALSRQAVAFLEEQARASRQEAELSDLGAKKKELDRLDKMMKALLNCQKIAARIMAGDRVPPEDLRYLEENDPEGYKLALALRKPKKDPKEWDSVLEDEDRAEASSGGAEPAGAVPAASGAQGGGCAGEAPSGGGEGM